jgi:hypothetical protein
LAGRPSGKMGRHILLDVDGLDELKDAFIPGNYPRTKLMKLPPSHLNLDLAGGSQVSGLHRLDTYQKKKNK